MKNKKQRDESVPVWGEEFFQTFGFHVLLMCAAEVPEEKKSSYSAAHDHLYGTRAHTHTHTCKHSPNNEQAKKKKE